MEIVNFYNILNFKLIFNFNLFLVLNSIKSLSSFAFCHPNLGKLSVYIHRFNIHKEILCL